METLIIKTKTISNANFILQLVEKLGETGKILSVEEQEDFLLGAMMSKEKTGKSVSRETIFKKLTTK